MDDAAKEGTHGDVPRSARAVAAARTAADRAASKHLPEGAPDHPAPPGNPGPLRTGAADDPGDGVEERRRVHPLRPVAARVRDEAPG